MKECVDTAQLVPFSDKIQEIIIKKQKKIKLSVVKCFHSFIFRFSI